MPDAAGKVSIIHAFSRRNSGDGLLVDLTLEVLQDAGVHPSECDILALDPESFSEYANVRRAPGEPSARMSIKLLGAACELVASTAGKGAITREVSRSRAIIAVGGGYLVADSLVRHAGLMLNHLAQLRSAARQSCPTIYLPQSIGPLDGVTGRVVTGALAKIDRIWARDDLTVRELDLPNVRRCPDLAVMKLGRNFIRARPSKTVGSPVLVARALPRAQSLAANLRSLATMLPCSVWAVQAETQGRRSDREFYRQEGFRDAGRLSEILKGPTGPVVSVRLHGAIAALLAGRPAVHLAYERKGWGAFEDLGLGEFVHDARNFDPQVISRQVIALQHNPTEYWRHVSRAAGRLSSHWNEVVADLTARLTPQKAGTLHAGGAT